MATFLLRRVRRVMPDRFVARWRLPSGAEVEHDLTKAEYRALAVQGASAPPNRTGEQNAFWVHAREQWVFDTPDGMLHPGDVTEAWPGRVRVFLGARQVSVPVARALWTGGALTIAPSDTPSGVTITSGVATVV